MFRWWADFPFRTRSGVIISKINVFFFFSRRNSSFFLSFFLVLPAAAAASYHESAPPLTQMPEASLSVPEMSGSMPELSGGDVSVPSVDAGLDVDVAVPSADVDASAPSASSINLPGESIYVNTVAYYLWREVFFFFSS